jgi:hypothetical protein
MNTVAMRSGPPFGWAAATTDAEPLPDDGLSVTQGAGLEAFQAHASCVLTPMAVWPPTDGTSRGCVMANRHGAPA